MAIIFTFQFFLICVAYLTFAFFGVMFSLKAIHCRMFRVYKICVAFGMFFPALLYNCPHIVRKTLPEFRIGFYHFEKFFSSCISQIS